MSSLEQVRAVESKQPQRWCPHFCNNVNKLSLQLFLILLLWMHTSSLSFVTASATPADLQTTDERFQQKVLSQLIGTRNCRALSPGYSPTSISHIKLKAHLQEWCWRHSRLMADVSDGEGETDYLGDYTPSHNVDNGVAEPIPSPVLGQSMNGNKRKLLQDYSPTANTNPRPTGRR